MPPGAQEIYEEGLRLPAVRLVDGGDPNEAIYELIRANVRTPDEREADLRAQRAANARAEERIGELLAEHGSTLLDAFDAVISTHETASKPRSQTSRTVLTVPGISSKVTA